MAPRETENNAYAKFWGDKQRTLWYVMVFSGVVNSTVDYDVVLVKGALTVDTCTLNMSEDSIKI